MECATGTPRRKHELSSMSSILNLREKNEQMLIRGRLKNRSRDFQALICFFGSCRLMHREREREIGKENNRLCTNSLKIIYLNLRQKRKLTLSAIVLFIIRRVVCLRLMSFHQRAKI